MASPQYEKLLGILWDRRQDEGDQPVEARRAAMD